MPRSFQRIVTALAQAHPSYYTHVERPWNGEKCAISTQHSFNQGLQLLKKHIQRDTNSQKSFFSQAKNTTVMCVYEI